MSENNGVPNPLTLKGQQRLFYSWFSVIVCALQPSIGHPRKVLLSWGALVGSMTTYS